jgi:hypothetical protein
MESRQEQTEVQIEGRDEAMQEQKITLILLHKLAGREPVTITQSDIDIIGAVFDESMPVLYQHDNADGSVTYRVIDARDVEAIEREVADGNAMRIVEALAEGAAPHALKPGAAKEAIERAGGTWPGSKH